MKKGRNEAGENEAARAQKARFLRFYKVFAPFGETKREPQDSAGISTGRARIRGGEVKSPPGGGIRRGEIRRGKFGPLPW